MTDEEVYHAHQLPVVVGSTVHLIQDPSDPMVAEFVKLKNPGSHMSPDGSHFMVEGPEAIRLLLSSGFVTEKILVKPSLLESLRPNLESADGSKALLLCDATLMERITGIPARHASAALALARRNARWQLKDLVPSEGPLRMLAMKDLDEESVGALFRVAAAFGVDVVLLDSTCGDPFHRRAVRVSMGHVLRLPFVQGNLKELLSQLVQEDVEAIALCQEQGCFLDELSSMYHRWVCLIDGEINSPSPELLALCRHRLAIQKMAASVPLGVPVASSILLNGCAERDGRKIDKKDSNEEKRK